MTQLSIFLNQGIGELFWNWGTSEVLMFCEALGESGFLSGLCAFALEGRKGASLFYVKTKRVGLA